jgi:hypothetical protein
MSVARTALFPLLVIAAGCAPAAPSTTEVAGQCGDLFGSQACTWADTQGDSVTAFGATIPLASITAAPTPPADSTMSEEAPPVAAAVLALPAQATQATGFTHMTVNWEAHGHPPATFLTPHFDFHFYAVSNDDRMAIDCSDTTKPAAAPAGYVLPDMPMPDGTMNAGVCVPQMGMHAVPESDMTATTPFNGSMIVGYYHGSMIFMEPMLARTFLEAKQDFTLPIATPTAIPAGVRTPMAFRATFDSTAQAWRLEFSDFGG